MTLSLTMSDRWSVASCCGAAFVCYAAASLLWSPGGQAQAAGFLAVLMLSFAVGYALREEWFPYVWITYLSFLMYNVGIAIAQRLGYHFEVLGYDGTWGLYGNPNLFGCALAIGLASALAYRLWSFVPPVAFGLWLTESRGAILGASAALFIWLWPCYKTVAFTVVALGLVCILGSGHGEGEGGWQRLGIWQDTLNHLRVWGSGWGSFFTEYWVWPLHRNIGFARPQHAYNDFLELTLELGIGSILLWVWLIQVMSLGQSRAKLVVWTYLVLALTFFPLWVWPVGTLLAASLGQVVRES